MKRRPSPDSLIQSIVLRRTTAIAISLLVFIGTRGPDTKALGEAASAPVEPWHYVSDVDLAKEVFPTPPMAGSEERTAGLLLVSNACWKAHTLLTNEWDAATNEIRFSWSPFANQFGPWFSWTNCLWTSNFLDRVRSDTDRITDLGKPFWHENRPYEDAPDLKKLIKSWGIPLNETSSTSCPSGHSTRGTVFALLFSELVPDKQEEILDIGREMGWHRVILGAHYPWDVYAGRVLGIAIVRQMKTNADFQRDFNQAKAEIAKARKQR